MPEAVKEREQAASGQGARYQALFENAPVPLWEEDWSKVRPIIDGLRQEERSSLRDSFEQRPQELLRCAQAIVLRDANHAALEFFGVRSKNEFLRHPDPVVANELFEVFRENLIAFAGGAGSFEKEQELHLENSRCVVVLRATIAPDAARTWGSVLVSLNDITRQKAAEDEAARSRDYYYCLFDNLPVPFWHCGPGAVCSYFNKALLKFTGRSLEEEKGRGWTECIHPDDREAYLRQYSEAFARRVPLRIESRFLRHDGEYRYMVSRGAPAYDPAGKFDGYIGISVDITDRRLDEMAVSRSEATYRAIFENTGMGTTIVEDDTTLSLANSEFERFSGYAKREIEGKMSWRDFAAPDERERMMEYHRLRRTTPGRAPRKYETKLITRGGEVRNVLITADIIPGTRRSVLSFLDITERKNIERALQERNRQLRVLSAAAVKANTVLEVPAILRTLVAAAMELVGTTRGSSGHLVDGKLLFREFNDKGTILPIDISFPPGVGVSGQVLRDKRPYLTNDAAHDPFLLPEVKAKFPIYNLLSVPVFNRRGQLIAALEVYDKKERRAFDTGDLVLLEGLAAVAATALENALVIEERRKAEEELRRSEERLRIVIENSPAQIFQQDRELRYVWMPRVTLHYVSPLVIGKTDSELFPGEEGIRFAALKRRVMETGESLHTELSLTFPGGNRPHLDITLRPWRNAKGEVQGIIGYARDVTAQRLAEEELRRSRERLELIVENSPDQIFQQDRELRYVWIPRFTLKDMPPDSLGKTDEELFPGEDGRQLFALKKQALTTEKTVRGVVSLLLFGVHRYYDVVFVPWRDREGGVIGVSSYVREITDRIEAQKRLQESFEKQKKTANAIIETMGKIVEVRDPYTAGHEKHTGELAAAIAREMGLSADQIDAAHIGAIVHDIGKIYVPAEILSKPGKLSDLEFNIIKIHPSAGYDILKIIDFPWPIAEIVYEHHERLNGSGYPRGLKNGQIRIEARVLAVADVIDSIAFYRPYRPRIGLPQALAEIKKNRGVLFDPDVVDAALRLFEKGYKY